MVLKLLLFLLFVVFLLTVAFLPDTETHFGFDLNIRDDRKLSLPSTFSGPLLSNRLLSQSVHLYTNEIHGPEAFAERNGHVYTGLADGRIVEILPDRLKTIAMIDPQGLGLEQCQKVFNFGKCGRPLGLRFDSSGTLYALDPNHGLFTVDVATGQVKMFLSKEVLNDSKFLDDFVLIEKPSGGKVFYFTDASTKWDLKNVIALLVEGDLTGRLLSYDTDSGRVKVEVKGQPFPNGAELTDDQSAILIASFTTRKILRYTIKGQNKGKLDVLLDNLPGEPDNIKRSRDPTRETYWVGLFTGRNAHNRHPMDRVQELNVTLLRFFFRLQRLAGFVLEQVGVLTQCEALQSIGAALRLFYLTGASSCNYGMALEIDGTTGQIVNSIHSPDGSTCGLSEVWELEPSENERHFWIGSAFNKYLAKLDLPKSAFRGSGHSKTQKVEVPKPEITKPKQPEQETPKKSEPKQPDRKQSAPKQPEQPKVAPKESPKVVTPNNPPKEPTKDEL